MGMIGLEQEALLHLRRQMDYVSYNERVWDTQQNLEEWLICTRLRHFALQSAERIEPIFIPDIV